VNNFASRKRGNYIVDDDECIVLSGDDQASYRPVPKQLKQSQQENGINNLNGDNLSSNLSYV
jgi:hypothetical protein